MKNTLLILSCCFVLLISCKEHDKKTETLIEEEMISEPNSAKALITKVVEKVGSMKKLRALKDVEYKYTFKLLQKDIKDVSIERYIFNEQLSWAKYDTHEIYSFPKDKGTVLQGFDGIKTWTSLDSKISKDPKAIGGASFLRKTNFYWFTMMQKLLDDGLNYELMEDRISNEITYKIVKITFDENVGDVQDDYVLYVNPSTDLVDKFLFTVKGGGILEPLLMDIEYKVVNDIYIMAKRTVTPADWDGNTKGSPMIEQVSENIKFNNGFKPSLFSPQ